MYKEVLGECIGVKFESRGANDNHICIRLLIEDDGNWRPTDCSVSSYWIDDMIETLLRAKVTMQHMGQPTLVGGRQWGWDFPSQKENV